MTVAPPTSTLDSDRNAVIVGDGTIAGTNESEIDFVVELDAPQEGQLARATALAAALEAMATGHTRIIAAELRDLLESMTPHARVARIDDARRVKRRLVQR